MTRLSVNELRSAARGRWPDVLTALGVPPESLTRTNKPCPACGGTDRFSFTDSKGSGSFVCRALDRQGGDGFELVMHWLGCDFRTALGEVAKILGGGVAGWRSTPTPRVERSPSPRAPGRDALRKLWRAAVPLDGKDPACRYLEGRGVPWRALQPSPRVLRYHPSLAYWHHQQGSPFLVGNFPALLAAVQGGEGVTVGLHRTYLTPSGEKVSPLHPETGEALPSRKLKIKGAGVMRGAAVRLFDPVAGRLALAEGIETALAVHVACGLPVWACVSAWGMQSVVLPQEVREVFIAADNDANATGQEAAQALAERLNHEGRKAQIVAPSTPGMDWLDVLNAEQEVAA